MNKKMLKLAGIGATIAGIIAPLTTKAAADATLVNTATDAVTDGKDVFVALFVSSTLVVILGISGAKWLFGRIKRSAFGKH